jgi:GNAT superfamily N-acetyltransferase
MDRSNQVESAWTSLLEPMNLHNSTEFDELLRQRIICGWSNTRSDIEAWRAAIDSRSILAFWVVPDSTARLPAPQRFAGHVSVSMKRNGDGDGETPDSKSDSSKPTTLHLWNLFVLPEHRGGGLGRAAVQALEAGARVEPYGWAECEAVTLNALSRRYIEDDGEEWRGMYTRVCASLGIEMPAKGSSNEDWYSRMGYVKWKEEPAYPVWLDGRKIMLIAAWLRKGL